MPRLQSIFLTAAFAVLFAGAAGAADKVPQLNVDQSCRAAATTGVRTGSGSQDDSACKRDEQDARGKLEQGWDQFSANDRSHCVRLSTGGGSPSYVELLTCLELAKQAQNLPSDVRDAGQGGKSIKP